MVSIARFLTVDTTLIDLDDRKYCLAPLEESPTPELIASIREHGILHPPLLQEKKEGEYVIISGRKRIQAIRVLNGPQTSPCLLVPEDTPAHTIYPLFLEHALIGSRLSLAEQVAFFDRLLPHCSSNDALPFLARLGHKSNMHELEALLSLRSLGTPARLALHQNILTFAAARKLLRLQQSDQQTLVALIASLHLGGSKQQKLIESCTELVKRSGNDARTVLAPFFATQSDVQPENIPQRAAALLKWLHRECFPRSTMAENEFTRRVSQLDLPANIGVLHAPAFEDDTVSLSLSFADFTALEKVLPSIRKIL